MTGSRGPVSKRKDELKGHRSRDELRGTNVVALTPAYAATPKAKQPRAVASWHAIAKKLWKAMGESQQSAMYEATDWEFARDLMEDLTLYKASTKRNSQLLGTIYTGFDKLLLTEGARRRLGIETEKRDPPAKRPSAPAKNAKSVQWDQNARRMWDALQKSEQTQYYEPSDWAVAANLMEDLTYYRGTPYRSGAQMQILQAAMSSLLITEGDRRRMQLDLHKDMIEETGITAGDLEVQRWQQQLMA